MSKGLGPTQRFLLAYMQPRIKYTVAALTAYAYQGKDTQSHRSAVRRALGGMQRKRLVKREERFPYRWHKPGAKMVKQVQAEYPDPVQYSFFDLLHGGTVRIVDGKLGGLTWTLPPSES